MKVGRYLILLFLFLLVSCEEIQKEESSAEFTLDIEFSEVMSAAAVDSMSEKIEYYRFQFSGSFGELDPIYVESKKFDQFVFKDIPADDRLIIRIEALSLNQQVVFCRGEVIINYYPGKVDHVLIPLECDE